MFTVIGSSWARSVALAGALVTFGSVCGGLGAVGCGSSGSSGQEAKTPSASADGAAANGAGVSGAVSPDAGAPSVYDFEVKTIDGEAVKLDRYRGKVLLFVNVASKCGFTPQYEALEAIYKKHQNEGFVVLGFPCDQFGHQEPGTEAEIKTFCMTRYSVSFPLFAKVEVNGPNAHPLYKYLRAEQPGSFSKDTPGADKLYGHLEKNFPELLGTDAVKWNFTKFLVDKHGHVVRRFESPETPQAIESQIVAQLAAR